MVKLSNALILKCKFQFEKPIWNHQLHCVCLKSHSNTLWQFRIAIEHHNVKSVKKHLNKWAMASSSLQQVAREYNMIFYKILPFYPDEYPFTPI